MGWYVDMMGVGKRSGTGVIFFFFNDTATTEIYTLSLHDALPICFDADLPIVLGKGSYYNYTL